MSTAELGTTFSPQQCEYLGFSKDQTRQAFREILFLEPSVIRLCGQWNRLEPQQGRMDFRELDWLINVSLQKGVTVALTVGLKAPRYPEFHIPAWLEQQMTLEPFIGKRAVDTNSKLTDATLSFVQKTVEHVKGAHNITHIQVENEPLAPVTFVGGWFISEGFLRREMAVVQEVKRQDQRTLLTLGALPIPIPISGVDDEQQIIISMELADDIGLDVYNNVSVGTYAAFPLIKKLYVKPLLVYFDNKLARWHRQLEQAGKQTWITESQAEPWEQGGYVHLEKTNYPSSDPEQAQKLAQSLIKTGYSPILLWGSEYWYWHKVNGNTSWWDAMEKFMNDERGK
ncbi:MAG TPA: hypothetical protein VMR81_01160 [Patescibacteria group bacterium]|nr:hypothetical protein [Patescibacteria group bacterium]